MNDGSCRIIAGKWRGRKITFEDAQGLRPTTDRIRETVFNWLQPYVHQSHCLDCFAGSGALGFEALSRGANELVFIENNLATIKNLKQNCDRLGAEGAFVMRQDTVQWLQSIKQDGQYKACFDVVFMDPPFHSALLEESCRLLADSGILTEDAIIYVESAVDDRFDIPLNWSCIKQKKAGQVAYKLFECCP